MKARLKKYKISIFLSVITVCASLFFGFQDCICTYLYGFPIPFLIDSVGCRISAFPIDFLALGLNLICHFLFWRMVNYLLHDFQSTMLDVTNFLKD